MGVREKLAALRTSGAPAWLTWLLLAGLAAVYIGERILSDVSVVRTVFTAGGVLLVLGATVWRYLSWKRVDADARGVERLFLIGYAGCSLAVIGFLLAGEPGDAIGIGASDDGEGRVETALTVLSAILLATSLLPVLAAQWAAGLRRGGGRLTGAIDRLRVSRMAAAGATVGLAGAFLLLTGYVASEHDATLDLSYFRTASPGTAVTQIAESLGAPLQVLLFFPPANQVRDEVLGYFRALEAASDNVTIEEYDRLAAPEVAEEHRVVEDGTIILSVGERSERLTLPTQLNQARTRLRSFDEEVQRSLMRVAREERTIYLTVGHGELNDPESAGPLATNPFHRVGALRTLFGLLNYRVQDLGVQSGLGNEVPADAAMVVVLGPRRAFLEAELQALDRYLERGGSVLLALEPESEFELGPLRERLGLQYHAVPLADDRQHLRQRGNASDRRLIVTDRFSSHESVSTLGQAGVGAGIALMGAGYIETEPNGPRKTVVVRSLTSTFADEDRDFEQDGEGEERSSYSLVVAVEGEDGDNGVPTDSDETADTATTDTSIETSAPEPGESRGPMRAMVFADAELFSDAVVTSLGLNAALAADAVRWLGREEELAGETASEEDVPIVHTRAEDVAWFYATIFGAPALVLAGGLLGVRRRRRQSVPGRTA